MKNLLFALLLSITSSLQAGFLVEPYLNYNFGSGDYVENGQNVDASTSGPNFGGRLGYQFLGLMAGMDVNLGSMGLDETVAGSKTSYDLDSTRVGLFAGYELPILLRAWITYYFSNNLEYSKAYSANNIAKGDQFSGSGLEFGVGFTPLPLLSVNVGYRINSYDELEQTNGTKTALNGSEEVKINEIFIGVSLPLEF